MSLKGLKQKHIKLEGTQKNITDKYREPVNIAILMVLTLIVFGNWIAVAMAADIYVPGNYPTVQDAIDNAGDVNSYSDELNVNFIGHFWGNRDSWEVVVSNDYAYIADDHNGLVIVNINNTPLVPVGIYDTAGLATGVTISGNYAYVADFDNGLVIVNISDPSAPELEGICSTSGFARRVVVSGDYAYVANTFNGLVIVDISNKTAPTVAGSYDTVGEARDVAISGNYAYVADKLNGLVIVNISNKTAPAFEGKYDTSGFAQDVAVSGNYAYVADFDSIVIVNISNPAEPTLAGNYIAGDAFGVTISGNYLFAALDYNGLSILNISNPISPTLVGSCDTESASQVNVSGNYAYVADHGNGLVKVDISNLMVPTQEGHFTGRDIWDVNVSGNYAYVADDFNGLLIIDISNPAAPTLTGSYDTAGIAEAVAVSGSYAYVADFDNGLVIVNISDPTNPTLEGSNNSIGFAEDVTVSSDYAYVTNGAALLILNISDPTAPMPIAGNNTPGAANGVAVSGDYAYVADGSNGLVIVNISNPSTPTIEGSLDTPGYAEDVAVSGNYAYIADFDSLVIVNISNKSAPSYAASYDKGDAFGVTLSGNYAYVAVDYNGLLILNISDPTAPTFAGDYDTAGAANDVAVSGNYAFVADHTNGLVILQITPFSGGGGGGSGGGGPSNLFLNPGFEYLTLGQPDNWTLSGTASVTNTLSSEGNNSLYINASINGDILFANQTLDIYHVAGKSYTFTFDIARSGGISGDAISFYFNYIDFNATEQSLYVWTPNPNDDSNFWMYYHEQIIPSDAFNITGFEMHTNGTGEYWIDNLSLAIEQTPPSLDLYQNYTIEVINIDINGSEIWLELDKNGNYIEDIVVHNLSTYEYRNATSDLIINGTVSYIKFLNNNRSWIVLLEDIWQFSDVDGSILINGTYNTFFGGEQYHDANVLPSGSAVLDIYESTGDVFSFDIGEVENDFMMVEGDAALMFNQTLNISGNLVDMGAVPIYTVTAAPTAGYVNGSVSPVLGHTYCINISGKYAKFEVVDVTTDNIWIRWSYQPDGTKNFIQSGQLLYPVHNLNKSTNYTTIQTAIDDASPGDEIHVDSGTYYENVNVIKQLTLRGLDTGTGLPVVDAMQTGSAITLSADGCTMDGFVVTNSSGSGIDVLSDGNYISDISVSNNSGGMSLDYSDNNVITNNFVINNTDIGFYISNSNNNILTGNTANLNTDGINLINSNDNIISGNTVDSNYVDGIWSDVGESSNNTITDNIISSNGNNGIILTNLSNYNITNNTVNGNYFGIIFGNSTNSTVSSNNILENWNGIFLDNSNNNNNIINNNVSNNNATGMIILFSDYNNISNNNLSYNQRTGIWFNNSNYNEIFGNNASNNLDHRGISLRDSHDNNISNNIADSNNDYGICLYLNDTNNNIIGNTLTNNNYSGIYLNATSNGNLIYNNYFSNLNNALDEGTNTWNITKTSGTNIIGDPYLGGNYWDDYSGVDNTGDGLGDTSLPYNSNGGIQTGGDWLPLTAPSGSSTNQVCAAQCHNFEKRLDINTDFYPDVNTSFDVYIAFQGFLNTMEDTPMNITDPTIELWYDTEELYDGDFDFFYKVQPTVWTPGYAYFEFTDMYVTDSNGTYGFDEGERYDNLGFNVSKYIENDGLITQDGGTINVTVSAVLNESVKGFISLSVALWNQSEFNTWVVDWNTSIPPDDYTSSNYVYVNFNTFDVTPPKKYNLTVTFYVDKIIPANITVKPWVRVYTRDNLQDFDGGIGPTAVINGTMFNMNTTFNSSNSNLTWKLQEGYEKGIRIEGGLAEVLEPYAVFALNKEFYVETDDNSINSGLYERNLWYSVDIFNEHDASNTVLGDLNFSVQADNITEMDWDEYATRNNNYVNWTFPSEFVIWDDDAFDTGFETDYSEERFLNVSIDRWMNQTVFNNNGYQLVTFNVTFDDITSEYNSIWAWIEANENNEVDASIVPGTLTFNAPVWDVVDDWEHEIGFCFDKYSIQPGVTYDFSVIIRINLTGNQAPPILYKPQFSVRTNVDDDSAFSYGFKAEMPQEMLPNSITYTSVETNVSNAWLVERNGVVIAELSEVSELAGPHAQFTLNENFIVNTQDDTITSGIYDSNLWYSMDINNEDDNSNTVMGYLNLSAQANNITMVEWEEYAVKNNNYVNWTSPSKLVLKEYDGFHTGFSTNYSESRTLNVSIDRWMNQTVFNDSGYQLVTFNVTFDNIDFAWGWADINANERHEVDASIVPGTVTYNVPVESFNEWEHGANFEFDQNAIQSGVTYNFSVIIKVNLTGNEAPPILYKPQFSIGMGTHYNYTVSQGYKVEMPQAMLPDYVTYTSVETNISNAWLLQRHNCNIAELSEVSELVGPHAEFLLNKDFYVGTSNDSLNSGIYESYPWYNMELFNDADASNTVLGDLSFNAQADNIIDINQEDHAIWNNTHVNWTFPSEFIIEEEDSHVASFITDFSESKNLNVNINRWMNQTDFNSPVNYQLANFNVTFEDTNFEWAWANIDANDGVDLNASIVPGTFTYDAPIDSFDESEHEINFRFDKDSIQPEVTYNFSVVIKIAGTPPVRYKPRFNVGMMVTGIYYTATDRYVAEMPQEVLPDDVTYASVKTNVSNAWLLTRYNHTMAGLEEVSEFSGPQTCAVLCHSYYYGTNEDSVPSIVQYEYEDTVIGLLYENEDSIGVIKNLTTVYEYDGSKLTEGTYDEFFVSYNSEYNNTLTGSLVHTGNKYTLDYGDIPAKYSTAQHYLDLNSTIIDNGFSVSRNVSNEKIENPSETSIIQVAVNVTKTSPDNSLRLEIILANNSILSTDVVTVSPSPSGVEDNMGSIKYYWNFDMSSLQTIDISLTYDVTKNTLLDLTYKPEVTVSYRDVNSSTEFNESTSIHSIEYNDTAYYTTESSVKWTLELGKTYGVTLAEELNAISVTDFTVLPVENVSVNNPMVASAKVLGWNLTEVFIGVFSPYSNQIIILNDIIESNTSDIFNGSWNATGYILSNGTISLEPASTILFNDNGTMQMAVLGLFQANTSASKVDAFAAFNSSGNLTDLKTLHSNESIFYMLEPGVSTFTPYNLTINTEPILSNYTFTITSSALVLTEVPAPSEKFSIYISAQDEYSRKALEPLSGIVNVTVDNIKPTVNITSPLNFTTFNTHTISVTGTASDNNAVANVSVDGELAVGTTIWSAEVTLKEEGLNTIIVEVYDAAGNKNTTYLDVYYVPPGFTYSNEFILPYAYNVRGYDGHEFSSGVYLIPLNDTIVWIDRDNDGTPEQTVQVYAPDGNFVADIPSGARITSIEPMMAYYYRYENDLGAYDDTVSTYTILPTGLLGKDYWIPCGTPAIGQEIPGITHITAVNDTTVSIDTNKDGAADIGPFSLARGKVSAQSIPAGSHILASDTIAVTLNFSNYPNKESDYVQILPTEMLGADYWLYTNFSDVVADEVNDSSGVYIVATKDNTMISVETSSGFNGGGFGAIFNKGDVINSSILTTTHISSNKPIQVLYRYDLIRTDPLTGTDRHMMASMPVIPTPSLCREFDHGYILQATQNGTTVQIDADRNKIFESTISLNLGEYNDTSTRKPAPHISKYVPDLGVINSSAPLQNYNYYISNRDGVDDGINFYLVPSSNATMMAEINIPPVVDFTFSPLTPKMNVNINFNSTAYDPDGSITNYLWDFGDGNADSGQNKDNTTHVYENEGTYIVTLTVTDDDSTNSSKSYTLHVLPQIASYEVVIPTKSSITDVGEYLDYQIVVKNIGDMTDTYTLTTTGLIGSDDSPLPLNPGQEGVINLNLTSDVPGVYLTMVEIKAQSASKVYADTISSEFKDILYAKPDTYEAATTISGNQYTNISFHITVTNTGILNHDYNLTASNNSQPNLTVTPSFENKTLLPGQTRIFAVNATTNVNGTYQIPVSVSSGTVNKDFTLKATFTVKKIYGVALSSNSTQQITDKNVPVDYNLTVRNTGNTNDTVDLYVINDNMDSATLDQYTLNLQPGEAQYVKLTVENSKGGTFTTTVLAISSKDPSKSAQTTLTTFVKDYSCALWVSPTESTITSDTVANYTITVKNTGNVKGNYTISIINETNISYVLDPAIQLLLNPGEIGYAQLTLTPTQVGHYITYVVANSSDAPTTGDNKTTTLTVNPAPVFDFQVLAPVTAKTVYIGDSYYYTLEVINTGNVVDIYSFKMGSDIQAEFNTSNVTLVPGEKLTRTIKVTSQNEGVFSTRIDVVSQLSDNTKSVTYYTESAKKVKIFITPKSKIVQLGNTSTFTLYVTNNADQTQTFNLTTQTDLSTASELSKYTLTIAPNSISEDVILTAIPDLGIKYITVVAESTSEPNINDSVTVNIAGVTEPIYGVQISTDETEKTVAFGNNATFMIRINNIGNRNDTYNLSVIENNVFSTLSKTTTNLIEPQSSEIIMVELNATSEDDSWIDIRAVSNNNSKVYDTQKLTVRTIIPGDDPENVIINSYLEDVTFRLYSISNSHIIGSSIYYSWINYSELTNCYVDNSTIENTVSQNSNFYGSVVKNSYIGTSTLKDAYVFNSTLDKVSVGSTVVDGKLLEGNMTVAGVRIKADPEDNIDVVDSIMGLTEMDRNIIGLNGTFPLIYDPVTQTGMVLNVNNSFVGGSINILKTDTPPYDAKNMPYFTGEFVTFESVHIVNNTKDIELRIYYDDSKYTEEEEKLLKIAYYDETSDEWVNLTTGVNTNENFVFNTTNHFSTFTLIAEPLIEVDDNGGDNGGSSGGGGGGGGGSSGEDFYNIVISETDRQSVFKNSSVSFIFDLEGNIVRHINFTALNSAGTVAAKVEMLNNTSTLVSTPPPPVVYKNLNIWVGNYGWATEKNMAGITVSFMVEKSWVTENDIDESTIALYRYSDDTWNKLVTGKTGEYPDNLYFEVEVSGFSPFAVAGQKKTVEVIPTQTPVAAPSPEVTATVVETATPSAKPAQIGLILFILILLGIGVVAYLKKDYIIEWINQRRQ